MKATRPATPRAPASSGSSRQTARLVTGLLLLGAAVRALKFIAPFHWPFHWDETMLATAALHVVTSRPIDHYYLLPLYSVIPCWIAVEVRPGVPGRTLRLAASPDGTTWQPIEPLSWAGSPFWTGDELLKNGGPKWAVAFPRTSLRYVRLSPAGPLRDPWTITEIECLE